MGNRFSTRDPNDIYLHLNGLYGYKNVVAHTAQVLALGSGSYGNVVKATLDRQPCAAKILHRVFVYSQDPGLMEFVTRFEQECEILRGLQHPNIVRFLGVVQDPRSRRPILLMELMKTNLTHFLESSSTDIPYHLQVNISHDITLAVAHLHRNNILHRDLSSNSILLNANCQAKLTDFGMSKIVDSNPSMTNSTMTLCPGSLSYMPPEALDHDSCYSEKIDCFSIGVLLLQITTRNYPDPTDRFRAREDSNSPTGEIFVAVSEINRRKSDIDEVPVFHGFLPVIKNCLKDKDQQRPTADQICQSLGQLKNTLTYRKSLVTPSFEVGNTDQVAQELIDEAMESGSLKQRNVVGVITGLMGSGKTTLLHHLFGIAPPNLYTSTGVAEQSFRGVLHHIIHMSAGVWQRLSHKEIRELLAPLIQAGMKEADVDSLATNLMHDVKSDANSQSSPLPQSSSLATNALLATAFVAYKAKAAFSFPKSPPLQKESPSCKEIAPLVASAAKTSPEGPMEDLLLELVHMIDTGGQPEAMEVMPSIIHNANLAMVLIDLRFGLLDCPQAHFHEEGVAYRHDFPSRHTTRDIILMLVSTLHAKKSLNKAFRLLIVATHRDCVKNDLEVRVDALNKELRSLLLPVLHNGLILSRAPDKIAFVLNLKNPDDTDLKALEVIRREVGKPDFGKTIETPTSFFVFEQDLLQYAEDVAKRDVLSFDECKKVGARIKMSEEMVLAALILFHRQNTFLYFHHVLPNHVFVNPKVPLDVVNGIVRFRYKVNSGKLEGFPSRFVTQLNEGIVTEELLAYQDICPHFKEGFYEVQDAITLFCHTFTLAPIQADAAVETTAAPVDEMKKEYLMMCLKPAIPDDKLHQYLPKSTETVPLVVEFSGGCVPLGCFGSTISCLLSKYGWKVIRKEDGSPKCLAHNIVALHSLDHLVNMVLVDFTQHLEIHIDSDLRIRSLPPDTCSQLYTTVFGAIEKVFNIMQLDTKISPAVLCPCRKVQKKHFATFSNHQGQYFLRCPQSTSKPDERQLLWMGKDSVNSDQTLPQLMRLQIPEQVGLLESTSSGQATLESAGASEPTDSEYVSLLRNPDNQIIVSRAHLFKNRSFGLLRLFWNLLGYRPMAMRLLVQIFYHEDNTATFVVTKNLCAHITAVRQTTDYIYMEDMPMSCEPTTDAITLSVPVDSNGWRITPSFEPAEIKTLLIKTYEPGKICPKIKLRMEWKGSGQPREELVPLSAHGGSIDSFTLFCKPRPHNEPAQGQPQPPTPTAVDTIQLLRNSDTPTLRNLLRFPTLSGAAINIVQDAAQNSNFGILLLNDENGTITGNITTEHGPDPVQVTRAIFRQWLQGTGRKPISWATLTAVLREANLTALAHNIEQNLRE